ncbi:MAG: hypothetical protein MSG64_18255 [Pyrinomonadaceae bacterium MAG19_C2-C3]|nr:hypothetical protein [Pyrinomonadaceae bacterium MAG19_C2-C3]
MIHSPYAATKFCGSAARCAVGLRLTVKHIEGLRGYASHAGGVAAMIF